MLAACELRVQGRAQNGGQYRVDCIGILHRVAERYRVAGTAYRVVGGV